MKEALSIPHLHGVDINRMAVPMVPPSLRLHSNRRQVPQEAPHPDRAIGQRNWFQYDITTSIALRYVRIHAEDAMWMLDKESSWGVDLNQSDQVTCMNVAELCDLI